MYIAERLNQQNYKYVISKCTHFKLIAIFLFNNFSIK